MDVVAFADEMNGTDLDARVRLEAFRFLEVQTQVHGDVLPRQILAAGFLFAGERIPLVGPQGIFKPQIMDLPLTITTVPMVARKPRPYDDTFEEGGLIRYRYRGTDPNHRDNAGLREVMHRRLPLVYFHGIVEGRYAACWPVYVVHDNPRELTFTVQAEDRARIRGELICEDSDEGHARRAYVTTLVRRRIHQQSFRERVLQAYREHCAVCRLRHAELLEAAHILPDTHERGQPVVSNGLALCSLHHVAFDRHILGVRPDLVVEIRDDILREENGPMLIHGLQGFQGTRILVPRAETLRPDRDRLAERYEIFRKAS